MATFTEPTNPSFDSVRQIETNDPVLGGAAEITSVVNSPVNYALRALVARTQWLKQQISGISTPAASRSVAGVARLASLAQVTAGSNDDTIVTPFLLQQKINTLDIPDVATQVDVNAGTDTEEFITPNTFRNSVVIQSVLPKSTSRLVFRGRSTDSPMNVTAEIIGNFGIFKLTLSGSFGGSLLIQQSGSDYWIPIHTENLFFYDISARRISSVNITGTSIASNGDITITYSSGLAQTDIAYLYMVKVR